MPKIFTTGKRDPALGSKILAGETDEARRADVGNYTTIASDCLYRNKVDEAVKALAEPPLSMPLDLAKLLIQAALGLEGGVAVDFETIFQDPSKMTGARTYSNFRKSKE